jgi:hypothetical protein
VLLRYKKLFLGSHIDRFLNFLSEKGNQNFIDIYNETFSDKKFEEALRILNI